MKKLLNLVAVAGLIMVSDTAFAQNGFDFFAGTRSVLLVPQTSLTASSGAITTSQIDVRPFTGIVSVDILPVTNNAATTITVTLQSSSDNVNWSSIANIANATATTVNWTNSYYGTNIVTTNTFLLPGTATTPTASTSGWATPYLFQAPFTNSGAITYGGTAGMKLGFKVDDVQRYVRAIITPGGTTTNATVIGLLTGKFIPTNLIP